MRGRIVVAQQVPNVLAACAVITTHGTLNSYDQKVPVVLFGTGIRAGVRSEPATPADIAPTLAAVAGVKLENVDGKVLAAALKKP